MRPELRPLGRTGILVPAVGLGAGPLGAPRLTEWEAARLIHDALDLGVTLFDTAPSYGASEARLGRALRGRRHEAVVVTKGGYGVAGVPDWTPECIARGVDQALERLATDHLEAFLLHSCPRERLARGDLLEPLVRARAAGKVRAVGYSGDGDALAWAVRCRELDVVECSVNLFDQEALASSVPEAASRGMGVLAKRAMANAVWRHASRPERPDLATYWDRLHAMVHEGTPGLDILSIRFATCTPGVTTALFGTTSLEHLRAIVRYAADGPLPRETYDMLRACFAQHGKDWPGVV